MNRLSARIFAYSRHKSSPDRPKGFARRRLLDALLRISTSENARVFRIFPSRAGIQNRESQYSASSASMPRIPSISLGFFVSI